MSDSSLARVSEAAEIDGHPAPDAEATCYDVVQGRAANAWFIFGHASAVPLASARTKGRAVRTAMRLARGRAVVVHVEDCPPSP